jgi:PAS domain-containing protein
LTSITRRILDVVPCLLMILNSQRQIVYANQALLNLVGGGEGGFGARHEAGRGSRLH